MQPLIFVGPNFVTVPVEFENSGRLTVKPLLADYTFRRGSAAQEIPVLQERGVQVDVGVEPSSPSAIPRFSRPYR